ncbi:MAG: NADH-quinone oxidoreductase subunit H, partial [Pseudonocardiaceae bacterium]
MADSALWTVLVLPAALAVVVVATAALDAVLSSRAAGRAGPVMGAASAPLREVARLLVGQRRSTTAADGVLWRAGVITLPVAALLAALVLPLGFTSVADLAVGVVWFNAMEILAWAAVWMAGWGPNAAFSLVGG